MWPFRKKEDFVVFIRAANKPFEVLRVSPKLKTTELEKQVAVRYDPPRLLGETAYIRISFKNASTPQEAANLARDQKLVYISPDFIAARKKENPEITMSAIRAAFARRTEGASKAPDTTQRRPTTMQDIEEAQRLIDLLSGGDDNQQQRGNPTSHFHSKPR